MSLCTSRTRKETLAVNRPALFGALLVIVCAMGNAQTKQSEKTRTASSGSGKQTYMLYCAACHGADARGDGPAATVLRTSPPDLTTLAKRHGGKFPYDYVFDVLRFGTRFASQGPKRLPGISSAKRIIGERVEHSSARHSSSRSNPRR